MNGKKISLSVIGQHDSWGDPEEFSWDLLPIVDPQLTTHLDENGLPKIGTLLQPGMILVGKIGKSPTYNSSRQPTALEIHALPFAELKQRYGDMWLDGSVIVANNIRGKVVSARLKDIDDKKVAVIDVELSE